MIYLLAKGLHSDILQSYGVEHTRRCFGHTGIGVALSTFAGSAFDDDAAQTVEVDEIGKFLAVSECA